MNLAFTKSSIFLVSILLSAALYAQQDIAVSDTDISRMGIIFAAVSASNNTAGARFPATVINSPDTIATLSARYSGVLEQWHHSAGSSVRAGQVLVTLRSPEILSVQNAWINARTELDSAQFALQKDQALFEDGVISQQRLLQTRIRMQQADFAEKSARQQLALAGFNDERLDSLRDEGEGLGSYLLLAPVDTVLTQRIGTVGDYIEANTPLAALDSGPSRWASIHVPAHFASEIEIGQSLSVADSGETLTLRQKDYTIDSSKQSIELFAEFTDATRFTTGQIVSVVLPPSMQGILVPERAVVRNGNATVVYVRTNSGVQARELDLLSVGADYLAQSGLREGDMLAIQGSAVLKGIQLGLGSGE